MLFRSIALGASFGNGRRERGKSWGGGERAYSTTPSLPNMHNADHLRHGVSSEERRGERQKGESSKSVARSVFGVYSKLLEEMPCVVAMVAASFVRSPLLMTTL